MKKNTIHTILNYESMASGFLQWVDLHTPKVLAHNSNTKNIYHTIQPKHHASQTNSRLFSSSLLVIFSENYYTRTYSKRLYMSNCIKTRQRVQVNKRSQKF